MTICIQIERPQVAQTTTSGSGAMSGPPAGGYSNPSANGANGGSSASGAPQGTGGDPGVPPAGNIAPRREPS
ncbi:MAG: hypothetical protein JWQ42_3105 [Edaphobacter sp.]|nr:hypothetical protein [Edaphobacter sp.]